MKKEYKLILYVLFFAVLLGECFLVLKAGRASHNVSTYSEYITLSKYRLFVRPFLVILLAPFVFKRYGNNYRDFFLYLGLLCSFLADVFLLSQFSYLIFAGFSMYALSYLLLAESFNRLVKRVKYKISSLFVFLLVITVIIDGLLIALPGWFDTLKYILLAAHVADLIFFINIVLKLRVKLKSKKTIQYILIAMCCITFSNIIYGISGLVFSFKHSSLDVATAFFYGLYLFFLVNSISYLKERQQQKEGNFEGSAAL
ncbi:MAG: lysoplasmalogenase family protein [Bacteroidota bacterium]|jgi:hypothetical protein